MSKNILVISTSMRSSSNSDALAEAFLAGAREAGNHVEKAELRGKKLGFCTGCLACQTSHSCPIPDDAAAIIQAMKRSDAVAFATPIYYYEMCGQMKTLLDRANPLFSSDYAFRRVYLLAAAAEDDPSVPRRAAEGLKGWIECFEKASLGGVVFAGGVNAPGEIQGHPALKQAWEMGRSIH